MRIAGFLYLLCLCCTALAQQVKRIQSFDLPDSVRASSFLISLKAETITSAQNWSVGLQAQFVSLSMFKSGSQKGFSFEYPAEAELLGSGSLVNKVKAGVLHFANLLDEKEAYRLMISTAGDSAGNFALFSAYVFIPKWNKWKFIGCCRVAGTYETIRNPAAWWQTDSSGPAITEAWVQRMNGSWKGLLPESQKPPVVNLNNHADSLTQVSLDNARIKRAIAEGKTDAILEKGGVFYSMMQEGYGKPVQVTDTVNVFYKGYLLSDGTVFDQTTDSPRRFPLNRLIPGWQIGLPLCTTGGKIKLVIPSHLAYGIRTRSPKIPPNSILVFEIEVVDTTPAL